MIYQRYKKTYIYLNIDDNNGTFFASDLKTHLYTKPYAKLDDLRDDLRLNKCKWLSFYEHYQIMSGFNKTCACSK